MTIQYRQLVDKILDAIVLTSPDKEIYYANEAACNLFNMSEQDLITGGWQSVISQDDTPLKEAYNAIEANGQFRGEIIFQRRGGTSFLSEISASLFQNETGQNVFSLLIRDITVRNRVETQIRERADRYRLLFNNVRSGIIIYKIEKDNLIIEDINPAGEKLCKISRHKAIGKSPFSLWPPTQKHLRNYDIKKILKKGQPIFLPETPYRFNHSTVWFESALYPLSDMEIVATFEDVTQRVTSRRAVEESEAKFRTVIETVNDGLVLFSADGTVLTWNKGAETLTGIKAEDIIGKKTNETYFKAIHEDGSPYPSKDYPSARTLRIRKPITDEVLGIIGQTGKVKWVITHTVPIFRGNLSEFYMVCVAFSDITNLKKIKEELEQEVNQRTCQVKETNSAIKVLLKKREQDLQDIKNRLIANCDALVLPLLARLKISMNDRGQQQLVDIIHTHLVDALSPFSEKLSDPMRHLTPSEIQIAAMITQGLTNKEMAQILNVSIRTITNHRDNIRTKLKLKNKKINLRSYLLQIK